MRTTSLIMAAIFLAVPVVAQDLRAPDDFKNIKNENERSQALFNEMAKVITHPRCMNCHPVGNLPRQGDDMQPHNPPVVRWDESGFGPPGLHCTSCHGVENVDFVGSEGSIPGHEPWHLPPVSMGWIGKSVAEICAQIKDPERNGDRTLADIEEHNATDGLVGWAWNPGKGRTPAPGSQEEFGALTKAWIETGAACPV